MGPVMTTLRGFAAGPGTSMLLAAGLALTLAACARPAPTPPVKVTRAAHSGPYADGRVHVETVRYNGRDYRVSIRRLPASEIFALKVAAPGRALGGTRGDLRIVQQIALSTLRHYACRSGHRAEAIPDSARHAKGAWQMKARCV